jgi:flagella basal body P-ring formation protein FlgA
MRALACLVALGAGLPAAAETLVPLRTIPPQAVIAAGDLGLVEGHVPGALTDPSQAVGFEARVALYPGRPIRPGDLAPPALVERNGLLPLVFRAGGLVITAEGRALDRAGAGEPLRVMNLSSRSVVSAVLGPDGAAHVSP